MLMAMACTNYEDLVRGQDCLTYQNSYHGEGNPLTAGIYSLLIPNSAEEIQQVSCDTYEMLLFLQLGLQNRTVQPRVHRNRSLALKKINLEQLIQGNIRSRIDNVRTKFTFLPCMIVNTLVCCDQNYLTFDNRQKLR